MTLDALALVGADRVRALVGILAEALDQAVLHQHDDDPLVRDLRAGHGARVRRPTGR